MAYRGVILGSRVLIFNVDEARRLYADGFYGKPLGVPKVRGNDFDEPLELDLIEALYLLEKGVLSLEDEEGRQVTKEEFLMRARQLVPRFDILYKVYKELRERGLVVRSGLKFGADFAVYLHGPGIDHAPFLVTVVEYEDKMDPLEIVKAGRLSHSVRKHFVIAAVNKNTGRVTYLAFAWFRL